MQNIISGIKRFKVYQNKPLVSINKKHEIYLDNSLFLGMVEDAFYIYSWKDIFIITDIYGKAFIVKRDCKLNKFLNLEYSISNVINNYTVIYRDYNDRTYYGVYDLMKEEILFETELGIGGGIFNDKMYFTRFEDIISFDMEKREILWQFSVADFPPYINGFYREQEADIKQIIGVYNNLLWVHVGGFRLIGIDVETGKLVRRIEDIPTVLQLNGDERGHFDFASFGDHAIHLDEKRGILKAFAHRYYIELDLNSLHGEVKKDFGEKWKDSWRIKNSTYYPDYPDLLFFSGYCKEMDRPNAFGIFDTEKAEIIWYDTHGEGRGYFYNPPQANDKILAVLDDKQNLLIYDRE